MADIETNGIIEEIYDKKKIEWKISFFSSIVEGKIIQSPTFFFENTSWYFRFCPNYAEQPGFAAFGLYSKRPWKYSVKYDIGFKKLDGSIKQLSMGVFEAKGCMFRDDAILFKLSEVLEQKCDAASLNEFTVTCILKRVTAYSDQKLVLQKLIKLDTLSENFKSLYEKDSCDVILKVKKKDFRAHMLILTARSPVFAAMFEHDTSEKQTGIIDIPDCDPDYFHDFLSYLYCGKLEDISFSSSFQLYKISDKYNVQELKSFCVEYMEQNVTTENVCDIVKLADLYDETKLMSAAQGFFNKNVSQVVETTAWENLMKNNYRLANKLIIEMSSKIKIIN